MSLLAVYSPAAATVSLFERLEVLRLLVEEVAFGQMDERMASFLVNASRLALTHNVWSQ